MSEINKNNLEEFFSNSMEQFSEVPSDFVWEGISDRLDEDDRRPILWWRRFLMMAIPFIAITLVAIYFIRDKNELSLITEQPITQNISKSKEVSEQNYIVSDSEISTKGKNDINSKTTNPSLANLNSTSSASTNQLIEQIEKQSLNTTTTNTTSNNNQLIESSKATNNAYSLDDRRLTFAANEPNNKLNLPNEKEKDNNSNFKSLSSANTQSSSTTLNEEFSKNKLSELQILNFPNLVTNTVLDHKRSIEAPPIIIINDEHTSKYRIGISGRFANTFVSDNNMFNGNESYGIRQEYSLTGRLAITNAFHFNIQHYDIKPESDPIRPVIVQRYTSRSFDDSGGLQKIESNSEYVDFSLGLKYGLGKRLFGFNTFINPSFVGQVYLPQTFSFLDYESNLRYRENKRIVMYLGSANLNFGIEKQINNHLHLQVSIWGEHSFIPIGLQREKIKTLGISTSLLFGK